MKALKLHVNETCTDFLPVIRYDGSNQRRLRYASIARMSGVVLSGIVLKKVDYDKSYARMKNRLHKAGGKTDVLCKHGFIGFI